MGRRADPGNGFLKVKSATAAAADMVEMEECATRPRVDAKDLLHGHVWRGFLGGRLHFMEYNPKSLM